MDKKALGRHINRLRKGLKLTQAEFERLTGVSERSIQQIEAGEANPGIDNLESIAKVLEVPMVSLIEVLEGSKRETKRSREAAIAAGSISGGKAPAEFDDMFAFLSHYRGLRPFRKSLVAALVFDDMAYAGNYPLLAQSLVQLLKASKQDK